MLLSPLDIAAITIGFGLLVSSDNRRVRRMAWVGATVWICIAAIVT